MAISRLKQVAKSMPNYRIRIYFCAPTDNWSQPIIRPFSANRTSKTDLPATGPYLESVMGSCFRDCLLLKEQYTLPISRSF